jgi:hypothetical protein
MAGTALFVFQSSPDSKEPEQRNKLNYGMKNQQSFISSLPGQVASNYQEDYL